MRIFLRRALIAAAALAVLAAAAAVVLRLLFPPEKLKAMALERLRASLGREVRLESASVGLRGISLQGLEISQEPDFKAGSFLTVGSARAGLRLKPLLRREIEIGRVALRRGEMIWRDKKSGATLTLSGIDLDAADVRRDGRFPAALAFSYVFRSGSAKLEGKADFKGAIDLAGLVPSRVAARADSIRIRFEDLAVKAYADFHDAEEPDLVLHIRDATAPFLAGARGEARVREAGSLATSGTLDIGRISHPNFTAAGASVEWSLDHADDLSRVTGRAKLKASDGNFQNLKDFTSGSPLLRAALFPLLALQKAGGLAKIRVLPAFDRVRYKEITGDYAVQNGIVTVKESHLDSSAAYVVAAGGADLGKDRVDLRLSTRLAAGLGADISGPIGFTVTGPLSDPSVKFDAASILKQPAVQNAVKQGQQLLRGLFQ